VAEPGGNSSSARSRSTAAETGRELGPRALKTRQRLLDATVVLLSERGVLDISVAEVARRAGTSPATFYHYFKDVEEAALALAELAAAEMPELVALIDASWRGETALQTARSVVDGFVVHWDNHHAVLMIRNFGAERGDRRFQAVRRSALRPVLQCFARHIGEFQQAGQVSQAIHPYAAAAALCSILEQLAAYHQELEASGVTRADLVETCARMLVQTVTGRSPSSTGSPS